MSVEEQYGKFVVRSFVTNATGGEVSEIAIGSGASQHVVEVENWSTLPYDVSVEVLLPQGMRRLSFNGTDHWTADISALAKDETDREEAPVAASGTSAGKERIHCTAVKWKKKGLHRWSEATKRLPLSLVVSVE